MKFINLIIDMNQVCIFSKTDRNKDHEFPEKEIFAKEDLNS